MLSFLRTFGWLASIVYATIPCFWLAIHPFADFWRRREAVYQILIPAWVMLWIGLGFLTAPSRHLTLYAAPWMLSWLPAMVLFASGIHLYRLSGRGFSLAQLGGLPELTAGVSDDHEDAQRLVVSGIRQRVRHPIYLAHLCELIGWALATRLLVVYLLLAFAIATGWLNSCSHS